MLDNIVSVANDGAFAALNVIPRKRIVIPIVGFIFRYFMLTILR